MRKFTPLDLSFIANASSPERENIRNVAAMINANAGWSTPSQAFLTEFKKAQEEAAKAAKHESTFLGGLFDLLSFPVYGLGNAMDEAIAGHQSDNNDSVLSDIGKTVGGVFTGLPKGIGAGLRGSTQILDVLPGVNISDEWQLDPKDKTHFGDVNVRLATKMSTADAMKPENMTEAVKNIRSEKAELPDWLGDMFYTDTEGKDDQEVIKNYLRRAQQIGIAETIGADPLNFIPGVGLIRSGKAAERTARATEGIDSARNSISIVDPVLQGIRANNEVTKVPKFGELGKMKAPSAITPDMVPAPVSTGSGFGAAAGARPAGISEKAWDYFKNNYAWIDANPSMYVDGLKLLREGLRKYHNVPEDKIDELFKGAAAPTANAATPPPAIAMQPELGPSAGSTLGRGWRNDMAAGAARKHGNVPVAGLEVPVNTQSRLAKEITALAVAGEKGWVYKAADLLRKANGNVDFAGANRLIEQANRAAKAAGPEFRHNAPVLANLLRSRIAEDVANARKVTPSERLLNTLEPKDILANGLPRPKVKLRPQQLQVANEVITKFKPELTGARKSAGTGEGLAVNRARKINAWWSGPQQARMWNELTTRFSHLPENVRYNVAAKVLQHVEDHFLSMGMIPYSGAKIKDSVEGLRLSQIAMAVGPKTLADNPQLITRILAGDEKALKSLTPEQLQAIENLKAAEAVVSAPAVQEGISAAKIAANAVMKEPWSAARRSEALARIPKIGAETAAAKGAGPVAAHTTKEYLNKVLSDPTGLSDVYKASRLDTVQYLARSNAMSKGFNAADKNFANKITNAITRASGLPNARTLGTVAGPAARVKDWFGARFNAAYGVADMRPIFLRNQASALSTSARRAQYLNHLARQFPPSDVDLWHEAFRAAQADAPATAGKVGELQREISAIMENLFGGTGLKAGAVADSTVAGRSRLYMNELNAQLRRFGLADYQFTAKSKVDDVLGNSRDFSKGAEWLNSWETWKIAKPYDFLHRMQNAVEHTVREKTMFDEIAARFASVKRHGNVKYAVDHPRLKGYFFTEEGARQAEQFVKILNEVNTPSSRSLQHVDHVISKLKAALTIYIPSHHWTNLIGDVMFNWFAGVNDVRRYQQAAKVMGSQRGRYGDITSFGKLTGPDALNQAIARGLIGTDALRGAGLTVHPTGNAVITTMRNGTQVTADMIYTAAMKQGILPSARVLEEITSEVTSVLDKIHLPGKAKGKVQRGVHVVSEVRDHIPRLAQFIDGISKSKGSFAQAVEKSAGNVRKWHPDGLDLTSFERNVMKRIFPFYSWTRKAIPLAIESTLVAGSKIMAYPRLMEEIALANGIDAPPGEQFPGDQLFPDWMRERGIGPVMGGPGNYTVVNPSTPALDIFTMLGHPGQSVLDMMNPLARVPLELSQGSTLGKQVPIENKAGYLAMQVPGLSQAGRVTGAYGVSDAVANSEEQRMLNLINLISGAKATQSGIYQKSAQFDLRDYLSKKAKEARGE